MGKKRVYNKDLPKRMYHKHGAYFFSQGNKWIPLGRNKAEALRQYSDMTGANLTDLFYKTEVAPPHEPKGWGDVLYARARQSARRRKHEFTLTRDELEKLIEEADGKCMLTGLPFIWADLWEGTKRPYVPSIDRIDSGNGYTFDNCRLVCACVNYALNEWGFDVLINMAKHMRRKRLV